MSAIRKPKTLRPVRPNAGVRAAYHGRLDRLLEEMHRSVTHWVRAAYRAKTPEIVKLAEDASPARTLDEVVSSLIRRWQKRYDEAADNLGRWFAQTSAKRSDTTLKGILKRGGFSVEFKMSRPMNDAYQAVIGENVGLIKSIPQRYLADVQGHVMRSVQAGRDLGYLTDAIEASYGVARRRAAFIARDQNQKATAVLTRVRYQEIGIQSARWLHSAGGKTPRPSHVKAGRDKVVYAIADGWFDPDAKKNIWPGELPNCRCTAIPVLPTLTQSEAR